MKSYVAGKFPIVAAALLALTLLIPQTGSAQGSSAEEILQAMRAERVKLRGDIALIQGKLIYKRACLPCHGVRGDGKGTAARGFDPAPRDFTAGVYKWRSTVSGTLPTDEDLDRTIRRGVPGTEMVGWGRIFSKKERQAVIAYIKTFSDLFSDPDNQLEAADFVKIPEQRPFKTTPDSIAAGKKVYEKQDCAKCHGLSGRGDGPKAKELVDDWDKPIKTPNLTKRYFKAGKEDRNIYRIFTTGLNGTPMPAFDELTDTQRWQLVDYIKSLESKGGIWSFLFVEEPTGVTHETTEN